MTKRTVKRRNKSATTKLRDTKVRAMAIEGKTQREIADEVGLGPDQVSRILNDEESKQLLREAQNALKLMIPEALATISEAMKQRNEFQMMGHALKAATAVLKSGGALKDKIEIEHTTKPTTTIVRPDGTEVVLGFEEGDHDDENGS